MQYRYHFSDELLREWTWSERFATQAKLLRYVNFVADRFDLRRDVKLDTQVILAHFDDDANSWTLRTDSGDVAAASYCIMATGSLSTPFQPPFPGLEEFEGEWYHTATWPHEGGRLHRLAGRHRRARLDRHSGHPRRRRRGEAPDGLPAHAELHFAGAQPTAGA